MTLPVLRGSKTVYAGGTVVTPPPLDVDKILSDLVALSEQDRAAFLCIIAHDFTVDVRALLIDRPVSNSDLDRLWEINEALHHLTSCINPRNRRSAKGDVELVRDLIEGACQNGLQAAMGRALANAANNMTRRPAMAAK
jgi:hypothetical protein